MQEDARVRIVIEGLEEGAAGLQKLLGAAATGGPGAAAGGGAGTGGGATRGPRVVGGEHGAMEGLVGGLLSELKRALPGLTAASLALAALQEPIADVMAVVSSVMKDLSHLLGRTLGTTDLGEEGRARQSARTATQQFGMETLGAASPDQMRAFFEMQLQLARMAQRGRTMAGDASLSQAVSQIEAGIGRTFHR